MELLWIYLLGALIAFLVHEGPWPDAAATALLWPIWLALVLLAGLLVGLVWLLEFSANLFRRLFWFR